MKSTEYTTRFGTEVTRADVIDLNSENNSATFIADLAEATVIPDESFDCFILTFHDEAEHKGLAFNDVVGLGLWIHLTWEKFSSLSWVVQPQR